MIECDSSNRFLILVLWTKNELYFLPVRVVSCIDANPSAAFAEGTRLL